MLRTEFNTWIGDFGRRYPAVAEYVKHARGRDRPKDDQLVLLDTWHRTLEPFTVETMHGVTDAIIAGDLPPIPNVDLGQFADQIRQRARQVIDRERERSRRSQPKHELHDPISRGDMQQMLKCGIATLELLKEMGTPCQLTAQQFGVRGSCNPTFPYGAAIILADDHTPEEAKTAHATLQAAGLSWEQILDRAKSVTGGMFKEVPQ